jgi:hypothetical protein
MCAIVVIGYLHMCTAYVPYDMGLRAFVGAWVGLCTQDAPCNIGYARVCASALEPPYNAQPNRPVQQRLNLLLQGKSWSTSEVLASQICSTSKVNNSKIYSCCCNGLGLAAEAGSAWLLTTPHCS